MTALHGNYTGTLGPNGAQGAPGYPFHYNGGNGGNGGNGVYALNVGGTQIGGGTYLPPGTYTSYGQIQGGAGGSGGTGGSGYIFGYGGTGGTGGAGGVGVDLSSGTLINNNTITGGAGGTGGNGGYGYAGGTGGPGSAGGAGVYLNGGTLSNASLITGGSGGNGGNGGNNGNSGAVYINSGEGGSGGNGGAGVDQTDGTLTNSNHITGGNGGNGGHIGTSAFGGAHGYYGANGGTGGAGVDLSSGTVTNTGVIAGGNGGSGLYAYYRSGNGGNGGAGLDLNGGTATNSINGLIQGGNGGTGGSNYVFDSASHAGNGGQGGAGVYLNGGTLTTSGTISGGQGGQGGTGFFAGANGANGDAVQFGTVASTLVVKPHAVFNGQVAANASVNDVLKLSGTQSGGTPITLGTQFTGFSTLTFASGAHWTVDASAGAAPSSGLTINGFTTSDTIDVTNLTPNQVAADLNSGTHVVTTASDGTLHFNGSFGGNYFVFSSDGGAGTDITLATGPINTTLLYTVTLGSAAFPSPLTITTNGVVAPVNAGATAVISNHAGNSLTNNGAIHGGAGSNGTTGGHGGVGVNFISGATFTNTGSIHGGTGGTGSSATGGAGGVGVNLLTGTLTNSGSISGGTGGAGATTGGVGGAGVYLNGGTLITSGSISGGQGGAGTPNGAAGDAVQFGTVASTLIIDPGAVFIDKVVAHASVLDVLELFGTQSGGTAITLGSEFINFATLDFAAGAAWTVDATKMDLTAHPLTLTGFGASDTLDITNLAAKGATASFNTSTDLLTITKGTTTIDLQFDSNFSAEHFVLTANGAGTDVSLAPGASATLAALGHDHTNFVGAEHRALSGERFTLSAHGFGSNPMLHTDPAVVAFSAHGFSSDPFTDHGIAHASVMLR